MNTADHRHQVRHERQSDGCVPTQDNVWRISAGADVRPPIRLELSPTSPISMAALAPRPAPLTPDLQSATRPVLSTRPPCRPAAGNRAPRRSDNTRVGDEPGTADLLAIEFRQAVHRLGEDIDTSMRHAIPLFPQRRILQTEVGGQIDDPGTGIEQFRHHLHRRAVRGGKENQVTFGQQHRIRFGKSQIEMAAEVAVQIRDDRPASAREVMDDLGLRCVASSRNSSTPV